MLTSRGLGTVLGDLASMGFDAKWGVLGAADVGAPHQRDRIWIVANSIHGCWGDKWTSQRGQDSSGERSTHPDKTSGSSEQSKTLADTDGTRCQEQRGCLTNGSQHQTVKCGGWWSIEPNVGRVADGVAARVDRLKAIGNGQVPEVARRAWEML
jgi:DNA (cytosine-5)-methyltransferase 1